MINKSLPAFFVLLLLSLIVFPLYSEDIDPEDIGNDEEIRLWRGAPEYDPNTKRMYAGLLYGKLGYSFLVDGNVVLGLDLAIDSRYPWQWEWMFIKHVIGIDYQYIFKSNESILRLNYIRTIFFFGGVGVSFLYNINNNEFGIAPQIGINNYFFFTLFLNCYYRYNIILNNMDRNFHEIVLTFNIYLPIRIKK